MTEEAPPSSSALDSSVLVLNKLYLAVHVINARRAFGLLYKELAEAITLDDGYYRSFDFDAWCAASEEWVIAPSPEDDYVRAVRSMIAVPRIIRLTYYDRLPSQRVKFNRRNVFARDGHRCQYCGQHFGAAGLSLDHVVPRSRGGPATWENIVAACLQCNLRKGGRTPHEAGMSIIRAPARPRTSPALRKKLGLKKYRCWKTFLDHASWSVEVK
jgi:5-methylcytosine-specific restriction endonuclease McrA